MTRTGSRCSRVGPAVTTTLRPDQRLRAPPLSRPASRRSAAATIASGSLMRPGRSLGPSASGPASGPMNCQPRFASVFTLACVAGCAHIASFIAGAHNTGPVRARSSEVRTSSASPIAARASRLAVAGARMTRSGDLASEMWASARSGAHNEASTGRPVNASNTTGRTNSVAAAVSTTSTAACASVSRRARMQLLYAAMPPDTPRTTWRPASGIRLPAGAAEPAGTSGCRVPARRRRVW